MRQLTTAETLVEAVCCGDKLLLFLDIVRPFILLSSRDRRFLREHYFPGISSQDVYSQCFYYVRIKHIESNKKFRKMIFKGTRGNTKNLP